MSLNYFLKTRSTIRTETYLHALVENNIFSEGGKALSDQTGDTVREYLDYDYIKQNPLNPGHHKSNKKLPV